MMQFILILFFIGIIKPYLNINILFIFKYLAQNIKNKSEKPYQINAE